jgi:hypothetical protein
MSNEQWGMIEEGVTRRRRTEGSQASPPAQYTLAFLIKAFFRL